MDGGVPDMDGPTDRHFLRLVTVPPPRRPWPLPPCRYCAASLASPLEHSFVRRSGHPHMVRVDPQGLGGAPLCPPFSLGEGGSWHAPGVSLPHLPTHPPWLGGAAPHRPVACHT